MDSLRDLSILFVLSGCMVACMSQGTYDITAPRKLCKPCQSLSTSERSKKCSENPAQRRLLQNDTFEFLYALRPALGEINEDLEAETELLARALGADVGHKPYVIADLKDINNSTISKYLRGGNPVERILHNSHGRTVLLIAYLNYYKEVLKHSRDLKKVARATRISNILKKLNDVSCKLYVFTYMFGVRKIKKNVCSYTRPKTFDESSEEIKYMLSVLQQGFDSFKTLHEELDSLDSASVLDLCKYECKNDKRRLNCGEAKKKPRNGKRNKKGKGRRRHKNRKNRDKKPNRNGTRRQGKNRRHRCKKNKKGNN